MNRRRFAFALISSSSFVLGATQSSASLRGQLKTGPAPSIETAPGREILLSGDSDTMGVLGDERLNGDDFEVLGQASDATHFAVDKIHTRSLFVRKDGKRLMVTYWCDVCYIRTYTPGKCWCCQKYTDLDLRESLPDE